MALLMNRVNLDMIRLVDRCHINTMLGYLRPTAQMFTSGITACMVQHGDYALIPTVHEG